jgi:hypothetical protein
LLWLAALAWGARSGDGPRTDAPDYADAFTLIADGVGDWSPEQWSRAIFEEAAGFLGRLLIWRVILCLRLVWRSALDHVAGWKVDGRGDGWLRMEARSWMLTGQLIVHVEVDRVSMATVIRYDRPTASRIWPRLAPKHRAFAPDLLRTAFQVLRQRRSSAGSA